MCQGSPKRVRKISNPANKTNKGEYPENLYTQPCVATCSSNHAHSSCASFGSRPDFPGFPTRAHGIKYYIKKR